MPFYAIQMEMIHMYGKSDIPHAGVSSIQKQQADPLMGCQEKTYV